MSANKQTRNQKPRKSRSDFQRLSRRFMSGFLRSLFLMHKPVRAGQAGQAGFVLPTTVLLLLVMTLTIGAMSFRTVSRTQSAFLAREQKMIDNIAAPAADRAKAKLEYLFGKDTRMPGSSAPPSDVLAALVTNRTYSALGITLLPTDPYTLPDETRIDINNDNQVDNAWSFSFDLNGDGDVDPEEVIAYSLLMDDAVDRNATPTATRNDDIKLEDTGTANTILKANNLITRNGPINTSNTVSNCGSARIPAAGWQVVNSANLEKNFQITAFVSNGKNPGRANSALELQQVRLAQTGNTWGAWFKYDLEVSPSAPFNWNGATHTDGSMWTAGNFRPHMISSHNSCLYTATASDMTMLEVESDEDTDSVLNINAANSKDFQGQLVSGAPAYGTNYDPNFPPISPATTSPIPLIHLFASLNTAATTTVPDNELTRAKDSVNGTTYADGQEGIMLDPIALFTRNISRHRQTGGWTRDSGWATNPFKARIYNKAQTQPFLDDFYRADNRYGPRPNYQSTNWVTSTDRNPDGSAGSANTTRSDIAYDKKLGDEIISTDPRASSLTNDSDGLDGYWERQAIGNGMRVVVGQRLDLGDHLRWNFNADTNAVVSNTDPLYPPDSTVPNNKQKQRVTLKDNLAAVQGMVVYQYESGSGQMPLACIANTAHPGTLETLRSSRTFNIDATGNPKTNFFEGQGTNGWEFAFPTAFDTETEFGTELATTSPLGIALRNLAYFAGDPNGGSPSFTPVQDTVVHPFPHQAMWGDFSILRRIFKDELDSTTWRSSTNPPSLTTMATRYAALSPADKSSLHSAACTMGLLAYNIQSVKDEYAAIPDNGGAGMNALGVHLAQLMDGNTSNGEIGNNSSTNLCSGSVAGSCPPTTYTPSYYDQFTAKQWLNALSNKNGLGANLSDLIKRAESIIQMQQLERDRTLGFMPANTSVGLPGTGTGYTAATGTFVFSGGGNPAGTFKVGCDPTGFATSGGNSGQAQLGLAVAFCSTTQGPKYPSLHYLFPKVAHGQTGVSPYLQPSDATTGEEYVKQSYLIDTTTGVNRAVSYGVVEATDIKFTPRLLADWRLPKTTSTATTLGTESMDIEIRGTTTTSRVALSLLDKVIYNSREEMTVRVLDVDLGKLSRYRTGGTTGDYWISDGKEESSGIFYAVREDAAREDSITRPASTANWTSCDEFTDSFPMPTRTSAPNTACLMRAIGTTPVDPPLSKREDGTFVGISIKPVDFVADPDRRPYGFRLHAYGVNGDISNSNARTWGLTFVTDNAAYIKGKFNPHSSNGTDTLEEFTQTLSDGTVSFGADFYNNRTTSNLSAFATKTGDRWRVAEVLADAVNILSDGFVDGAIDEGFIRNATVTSNPFGNTATSFNNQQRPLKNDTTAWGSDTQWLRVDGTMASSNIPPIWVGRNGQSKVTNSSNTPSTITFTDVTNDTNFILPDGRMGTGAPSAITSGPLLRWVTAAQRTNATIISGIVPSRRYQTYGGMNNFPRFLEKWAGRDLFIQGAFLQLNFSSASTGPFDADIWEPGATVDVGERNYSYQPPNRIWGYDVALQLVPSGPISARFVSIGRPRSEHYRELPVEDPYVTNLRCSKLANGTRRFPTEAGCP
jgi:hypothetical protein